MMAGVVNETAQPGMGLAMVKHLNASLKGGAGPSSCMAAFWMLQGLYRVGWETPEAADLALHVMVAEGQYSWRNMLAQGATCTMETWPSGTKPGSGGTGGTWSHPWCAGANSAIIRLLVGVKPIELGWQRWMLAPQPSSLKSINATIPFVHGDKNEAVEVSLEQMGNVLSVRFSVPAGTTARVCLPAAHGVAQPTTVTLDGKAAVTVKEGRMLCVKDDVAAGQHTAQRA